MYTKKYLKELYTMNQDLKNVFKFYYVYNNGIILNKEMTKKNKGVICMTSLYVELNKPGYVIMVNSILLYEIFKNYKMSQIEGMEVKDLRIGAIVEGEFKIFAIYQQVTDIMTKWLFTNNYYVNMDYKYKLQLPDDDIKALLNKEIVNVRMDNRRIILCKSTIPILKKTSVVNVHMETKMTNDIFHCKIITDNSKGVYSLIQVFRCLNV